MPIQDYTKPRKPSARPESQCRCYVTHARPLRSNVVRSHPIKSDPSRTKTLRKKFEREISRRASKLARLIVDLIVEEDAFGLKQTTNLEGNNARHKGGTQEFLVGVLDSRRSDGRGIYDNVANQRFAFQTAPDQLASFERWLADQQGVRFGDVTDPYWEEFIQEGYEKGAGRAFDDTTRARRALATTSEDIEFLRGSKEQFLRDAFAQPETREKISLLASRTFGDLRAVDGQMAALLNRTLSAGLSQGMNPRAIARTMLEGIGLNRDRAQVIARTEIIRAHAEGQLDAMERMGVEKVGVMVEWSTAGDDRVCFKKGTSVEAECGQIKIEDIEPGMKVLTRKGLHKVIATSSREYVGEFVAMKVGHHADMGGGGTQTVSTKLVVTGDHPFWLPGLNVWGAANYLSPGDSLESHMGSAATVDRICAFTLGTPITVYNIEVADEPEFFANGVLVHNCPLCQPLDGVVMKISEARGLIPRHPQCFVSPSVPITTEAGSKPINKIKVGDYVLTHKCRLRRVMRLSRQRGLTVNVVKLNLNTAGKKTRLVVTEDHPIRRDGEWIAADCIEAGDTLTGIAGDVDDSVEYSKVNIHVESSHSEERCNQYTYNFSVDEDESYVANGVVVHNCRCAHVPAQVGEPADITRRVNFGEGTRLIRQRKSKGEIEAAFRRSVGAERKKGTLKEKRRRSTWQGADRTIAKKRPKSILETGVSRTKARPSKATPKAPVRVTRPGPLLPVPKTASPTITRVKATPRTISPADIQTTRTLKPVKKVDRRSKLGKQIIEEAEEFGIPPEDLRDAVDLIHTDKFGKAKEAQVAKDSAHRITNLTSAQIRQIEDAGFDHSSGQNITTRLGGEVRRFDVRAVEVARQHPELGLSHPDEIGVDIPAELWDILREPRVRLPQKTDSDIVREAADYVVSVNSSQANAATEALDAFDDFTSDIPF